MKKNIIYLGVLMLLLAVLTFSCLSIANLTPEERREKAIEANIKLYKLDLKMADKNVPIAEQCIIYCDDGYSIKEDKAFSIYSFNSLMVIPVNTQRIWARYQSGNREAEMEITFTSQPASIFSILGGQRNLEAPKLEAGQSYWLLNPHWVERSYGGVIFMVIRLNDDGIKVYTENMWARPNGNLYPYGTRNNWESYEKYHEAINDLWDVRKEATKRQINNLK